MKSKFRIILTLIFIVYLNNLNLEVRVSFAVSMPFATVDAAQEGGWVRRVYHVEGKAGSIQQTVEQINAGRTPFIYGLFNETTKELVLYTEERVDEEYISRFLEKTVTQSRLIAEERNSKMEFLSRGEIQFGKKGKMSIKKEAFDRLPLEKQQRILAQPERFEIQQ